MQMWINENKIRMNVDYDNSLVSLISSVLRYYGAEYGHTTFGPMDELLQYPYKNVVIMLFDGMGLDALRRYLPETSFLRRHLKGELSSVFPPTTTAATTSIESGLTPAEHGWLGWSLYFPELDGIVEIFPNTRRNSDEMAAEYHAARRYLPYKTVYEKIEETKHARAYTVTPFRPVKISGFEELFHTVKRLCQEDGRKYIYSYWAEPDQAMHSRGCYDGSITEIIESIDRQTEALCRELKDTLVIVTADHGHCNTGYYRITDYPELDRMLIRPPFMEPRAALFSVKEEARELFPEAFSRLFGDKFLLMSLEEALRQNVFGSGTPHPRIFELAGDYLAVAVGDMGIVYDDSDVLFKSHHAGFTEREMKVPFIAVEIKE